ncbi:FAD-linked oxidase [Microtetraspora sp. NBRC 13810]|uniref:FAD-binding oxidoreductase n=1 Tax=Microtetraspora sp. NBRC 13810 TaxID=3030990 RepID=UPI0024A4C62E|nr:FAD-binding oxidoreductase [Microtetraspora sp. NBRC 13810]GLW06602.1 FAD-linked oxidase [Microtetraspora sp. NBRC 13810]
MGGRMDRRDVLRLGARITTAGLAAGLVAESPAAAAPQAPPAPFAPDPAAWRELARWISPGAGIFRPSDAGFDALAAPWNPRYAVVQPAGIVACATAGDVQAAVRWAAKHGVPLVPRTGGHNFAGQSTTYGLLLSMRRMNSVSARRRPGGATLLTLGGGALNAHIYEARALNLYTPGGRCAGTGVAGVTLGGGVGFNDRKWGLGCDRLLETSVVLAGGELVRCSERQNADLFWACRGGAGGNFGINTELVFDAVPVGDQVATVFDLTLQVRDAVRLFRALRTVIDRDRANDLDVWVGFANTGGAAAPTLALLGQYLGDQEAARRLLAPLFALRPTLQLFEQRHFWQTQDHLLSPAKPGKAADSRSLTPYGWPGDEAVEAVADWVESWPGGAGNGCSVVLFAMGGAAAQRGPSDTAFAHRRATFMMNVRADWTAGAAADVVDRSVRAVSTLYLRLRSALPAPGAYVNFPHHELPRWWESYYGGNYARLVGVKRHYDPGNFFRHGQSIGADRPPV